VTRKTTETYEHAYELDGIPVVDAFTATTLDGEVSIRFYTDGVETGGPDHYEAGSPRLREFLQGCAHDGYTLAA